MSNSGKTEKRREIIAEINAIWALEGFDTTPEIEVLQERYILGEISIDEFQKSLIPAAAPNV